MDYNFNSGNAKFGLNLATLNLSVNMAIWRAAIKETSRFLAKGVTGSRQCMNRTPEQETRAAEETPLDLDYAYLSQLSDPETGNKLYLLNPIVIRLRQDQVLLGYPVNYLSAVNGKATEIIVNYENTKNYTGCDDTSKINPTCGLKHDRGSVIPYSQGFCCFCPEEPVNAKQARGGQDCSLDMGKSPDSKKQMYKASAHCMELSNIWYSVCALSEPAILHETYVQVYNQRHLKNGSSVWVALTHDEDFQLGLQNPYQYDENKTIVISYVTERHKDTSVTIPIQERRLLIPQQMPGVSPTDLPDSVKNGAKDYLLIPKALINPVGDSCDTSGVSYEAFALQEDRCKVKKNSCLKNQPLDFWKEDNVKRKAGAKGSFMLENFGTPYKDPIIVDAEKKDRYLAIEYLEPHVTTLTIEINADEIPIMAVGKEARITKVISASTKSHFDIYVSILNSGLMPAKFKIQAIKCGFGVPDSNSLSLVIAPQMVQDVVVSTKSGSDTLDEAFTCSIEVSNVEYGVVATRKVTINPNDRCICNFHCECACLLSGNLQCEIMSVEDYQAAGFRGSMPVLTAKPPQHLWFVKHPFLALFALTLLLLLMGINKGLMGLAGCKKVGAFGLKSFLYQPKKISYYLNPGLRNLSVVYDTEGYPIDPDTKDRVQVIEEKLLFGLNVLFFFFWPFLLCKRKALTKKNEDNLFEEGDTDNLSVSSGSSGQELSIFPKRSKSDKDVSESVQKQKTFKNETTTPGAGLKGPQQPRQSMSDSLVTPGFVSNNLKNEFEKWQKE